MSENNNNENKKEYEKVNLTRQQKSMHNKSLEENQSANLKIEIHEKENILKEILNLGEKMSKEAYREFYEIGERREEDWGE